MNVTTYFGFICPKCKSTVAVGIGEPNCPSCSSKMIPNKQAKPTATNVYCKKCNILIKMLISSDECPECRTKFE